MTLRIGPYAVAILAAVLLAASGCSPVLGEAPGGDEAHDLRTLTIRVSGEGSTSPAAGSHGYAPGAEVRVTAVPGAGATFTGWSGAAAGRDNPLTLTLDADEELTATFAPAPGPTPTPTPTPAPSPGPGPTAAPTPGPASHTLTVSVSGGGSTSPPAGVHAFAAGAVATVTAKPDAGMTFSGWSGAATGASATVDVTMDSDKSLTASFTDGGGAAPCDPTPPSGPAYFAAPTGTGTACTLAAPCSLATAAGKPNPGETVYLRGGTYPAQGSSLWFNVSRSGDPARGWITFAAYPCELPIIDAGGVSVSGSYVRFDGLVARNAQTGFGNKWTGGGTTSSNGHLEFLNCIADMNSMAGIAFRSAPGVHVKQCIVAHNGSSTTASWSSGVDLFGAQGSYRDNVVESTVAFENVDMQHHSDGSGFIVDDIGTGATFVNNIGFRNGGSCIRLTTSTNTHIINNTCYHDGLDPQAGSDPQWPQPKSPGEILFSSPETRNGAVLLNNLAAASGWNGTQTAYVNAGALAIAPHNLGVDLGGATPFFQAPEGVNPDFRIAAGSSAVVGAGSAAEAPATDIGFDPKCITRTAPAGAGVQSWWIYSIDYAYIQRIGGVARCFHPKARTGAPDLGAYAH